MRRLLNPVLPAIPNIATPSAIPAIRPARPNLLRRRPQAHAQSQVDFPGQTTRKPTQTGADKTQPQTQPPTQSAGRPALRNRAGRQARRRMRRNDLSGKKKRLRAQPSRLRPTAADAPRFDSAGPNLSSKRRVNSKGGAQRRRGESSRRETARRIQRIGNSATARADRSRPIQRGRANGGRDRRLDRFPPLASPRPSIVLARAPRFSAAPASILASWRAALGLLRPNGHLPQIGQTPGERGACVEKQRMQRIAREGRAVDAERGGQGAA